MRLGAVEIADLLGLDVPTPEQVAVVEAPLSPLLVVAGAGSGKTETMTARVVYLTANGLVERDRVLGLTFTRKAAGELSERVRRRLRALDAALGRREGSGDGVLVAPTVATYNSYAAGIVGEHALRLGVEPSARLLGEAGRWQLAHDVVATWDEDLGVDLAPVTITDAVLGLAGELAEHLVSPDDVRRFVAGWIERIDGLPVGAGRRPGGPAPVAAARDAVRLRAVLMDLVEEFTARKRERDLIDFADQVALAARLAAEVPEVGAGERSRFQVVLLDEYQDTSVAQLALLRHLFGDLSGDGVGHPVTAVGDPHQSIYGWRGASAGGLERFGEQFPVAGAGAVDSGSEPRRSAVLHLSTSWRNEQAILVAANTVSEPLRGASARLRLPLLVAAPRSGRGEVAVAITETAEQEATEVARYIADRRGGAALRRVAASKPVTAAVLCRKRSQFGLLHAALLDAGLPVEVVGLGGLLAMPEVVDLVAALEAAHDPSRGDSLMRLLTGPRTRLGLADLHALADWSASLADERSIVDAVDELPRPGWVSRHGRRLSPLGRARLADLGQVLRSIRSLTYLPVADLVAATERLLRLDIEVAARPGRTPSAARAHLDALRGVAAEFDADGGATLGAFLAWLDAAVREERGLEAPVADLDPDAVQLLTVHAAKGLEWDVVAVPGLVEGTFPVGPQSSGWVGNRAALPTPLRGDRVSLPDLDLGGAADLGDVVQRLSDYRFAVDDHHRAEERRLAYVAMTRARSHLLLAASRWRDGARPTPASAFLTEIAGDRPRDDGPVTYLCWAPDPASDSPARPDAAERAAAWWPADRALGVRQDAVDRAAETVRRALERGTTQVPAGTGLAGQVTDLAAVTELLLHERRRGAEQPPPALPGHLSASAVVRLAQDREEFARQLRRPVPLAPSTSARRGTAFHAWVESYFGAAALVDVDALPGADDESVADDEDLAALRATFLDSPWARRSPVAVEVDVQTTIGGVVLRSRIDAVFAEPDGVVVVDWKTGRPPSDAYAVRTRELQLAVYRLAWSRWKGLPLERVDAAFYYVATGETVRATQRLGAQDIEGVLRGEPVAGSPGRTR
jgi:DNA helicase-2/ATP-dependent DNA helicase PcrA